MSNWLIATGNQGKVVELRRLLTSYPVQAVGLKDLDIHEESPETGTTFLENARQKAEFYFQRAQIPVLADDSGLEVDALNGAPGIYSARFGGLPTHAEKCHYLLSLLTDVDPSRRAARFCCCAVYYDGRDFHHENGYLEGFIGTELVGSGGFGYDPVFHPEQSGPSLAQYDLTQKNRISHRGKAFKRLFVKLARNNYL